MVHPLKKPLPDERENWLVRYIGIQKAYDKQVFKALARAAADAEDAAKKYEGKDNITSRLGRYRATLLRNEIRDIITDLYKHMEPIAKQGQADAAEAAAKAMLAHDAEVLKALFPNANRRKQFEASFKQAARQGIQAMVQRVLNPQWPLSERIWRSKSLTQGVIDRKINSAIARGAGAKELAKLVRDDIRPNAPGGTSYCALRLARTEINNAYHAQSIGQAQDSPWVSEMEWHLSLSHKEQDCFCEYYAEEKFFEVNDVPPKPHPQCMCYVTPVSISYNNFAEQLKAGQFDDYFEKKYGMPAA